MTCSVTKIADAGQAFAYFSEKDDYYLSDKSAAEWYGSGAGRLGLRGDIQPGDFRDVLTGRFGDAQVGSPNRHTPGWDVTMDAPKSVSIAALVHHDDRLIKAHDHAVRAALDFIEAHAIVTRQRDGSGDYRWMATHSLVAGVVRHSSSRNLDPQLHSHCVVANVTRDELTDKWVSIDSRAGLYASQKEAGNVYMSELARGVRAAGYAIEWRVAENGNATFEIVSVSEAERGLFSTRNAEIRAALAKRGLDKDSASGAAREAAALATRSDKTHLPAAELHARWAAQAEAAGFGGGAQPNKSKRPTPERRQRAAREAVAAGIAQLSERQTRFTLRQVIAEATTFAQGRATQAELTAAVHAAHEEGDLPDRGVQVRGYSKDLELASGYTTRQAIEVEQAMLARAHNLTTADAQLALDPAAIDRLIADRETATGHAFTGEQRGATRAILAGGSGLHVVQGYAGTAKTTSVLAAVADAAKQGDIRVRAIAPTHSAADTLGHAIGAEASTVAALNSKPLERDERDEVWIVDEAGMVSARDMRALLTKADQVHAEVILTGDTRQIGSVGAGSAFQQLQDAHPSQTHSLTDIKRQTSSELKAAVYASLNAKFDEALGKVDTREIKDHDAAIAAIADRYMDQTRQGKDTLVVTLSRSDRDAVNAAIQQRREAAGEVRNLREVATLRARQWTRAEQKDAARYQAGDVIESLRNYRHGPRRCQLAAVESVQGGRITARRANGDAWTFDPARTTKIAVLDKARARFGSGDRIVAKGTLQAYDATGTDNRITIKNGTAMTVDGVSQDAETLTAKLDDGRRVMLETQHGLKADLAYAQTANQSQGRTTDATIAYLRSSQTNLADRQHAYVALSRARESATVVTDDRVKLAQTLAKSARSKEAALEPAPTEPRQGTAAEPTEAAPADEAAPSWMRTTIEPERPPGRQEHHPAQRTYTARMRLADFKAGIENAIADARARARERKDAQLDRRDRQWLVKGAHVRARIARDSTRREGDIARRFGTKVDAGWVWRAFESKRARTGRQYIQKVRADRDQALNKIDTSLEQAFARRALREAKRAGISMERARGRVAELTHVDRNSTRAQRAPAVAIDRLRGGNGKCVTQDELRHGDGPQRTTPKRAPGRRHGHGGHDMQMG